LWGPHGDDYDIFKWNPLGRNWGTALGQIGGILANSEGIATFMDKMFFPLGEDGYSYVSESGPGTLGAVTVVAGLANPAYPPGTTGTSPRVHAFGVHKDSIHAITTETQGYTLVSSGSGTDNDWDWEVLKNEVREDYIKIETSFKPHTFANFPNQQNSVSFWVSGRRGLKVLTDNDGGWGDTNLTEVPPHPDFGKAMHVFRPGEALWVAGGGGDIIQYTIGGNVVPASGPGGAKEGVPYGKRGSAISFATDLFHLYALYRAIPVPNDPDPIIEDTDGDDPFSVSPLTETTTLMANNGKGWHPVWESKSDAIEFVGVDLNLQPTNSTDGGHPIKVVVSDMDNADGTTDYRVFWNVGSECWSMQCRLSTTSSRQAIKAGAGERFNQDSYVEWGEFFGGSIAINKLASHVAIEMEAADAENYVEYEYSTDRMNGRWETLGRADHGESDETQEPRIVMPFGLLKADGSSTKIVNGDGVFSEGLSWRWFRQRIRYRAASPTDPPIIRAITLAFLPITQDAATKAYTIPLPVEKDEKTGKTAEQIINAMEAMLSPERGEEKFLFLQEGTRRFRCLLSSLSYAMIPTNDARGALNITVIEIPTLMEGLIE
jgi:hypothetical protein